MRSPFRLLPLTAALFAVVACGDDARRPTSPLAGRPVAELADDRNDVDGKFFVLPPLAPSPSGSPGFTAGAFSGAWQPAVSICALDAALTACAGPALRTFTRPEIVVSTIDEHYQVNWDTSDPWAVIGGRFRISFAVPALSADPLGHVDVEIVPNESDVSAVGFTTLQRGRTTPVKFRLEQGLSGASSDLEALVTNDGGLYKCVSSQCGWYFSPGWLDDAGLEAVTFVVERRAVGTGPCVLSGGDPALAVLLANFQQFEGCFRAVTFPDMGATASDIIFGICSELAPTDPRFGALSPFKFDAATATAPYALVELPNAVPLTPTGDPVFDVETCPPLAAPVSLGAAGTILDGARRVAGRAFAFLAPREAWAVDLGLGGRLVAREDAFSDFFWGVPFRVDLASGNGQTGNVGTLLAAPARVRVTGTHVDVHDVTVAELVALNVPGEVGLANAPVTFTVAGGGGSVGLGLATSIVVSSDADGYASAPWVLGFDPGVNTLVASIPDDPGRFNRRKSVEFTATGVSTVSRNNEVRILGPASPGQSSNAVSLKVGQSRPFNAKAYSSGTATTATCVWSHGSMTASTYVRIYVPGTDPGAVELTGLLATPTNKPAKVTVTCGTVKRTLDVSVVP